jgi:hypothetical protein
MGEQIKNGEISCECSTNVIGDTKTNILIRQPEGRRQLERLKRRRENKRK